MKQLVPNVSRADVERIVRRDFPREEVDNVLAILDEYKFEGGSSARVQLAVLKLADGDVLALRRQIGIAKLDFRDVIAPAEYPAYTREIGFRAAPDAERQVIIDEDWRQYERWLKR